MLKTLTRSFSNIIKKARGQGRLTEDNIATSLGEIRNALLEADVALPIADQFLAAVKNRATGTRISTAINPGQAFAEIVRHELISLMGSDHTALKLKKSPAIILGCGLQGVGKTTNLAKIAKLLKTRNKKRVVVGTADIYRPAAHQQLSILADSIGIPCINNEQTTDVVARAKEIITAARKQLADVAIIDTAGRTTVDDEMMNEIRRLCELLSPAETLFFIDAMQGQDALNTAHTFHKTIAISGIVLTKFDGDSGGGAALSARAIIGAPIKFVGVGEKMDDLQEFHPARFAQRLLGLGDLASLAEQAAQSDNAAAVRSLHKSLKKPNSFDLNDQLEQIRQIKKMGGIQAMADKMPAAVGDKIKNMDDEQLQFGRMEAVICAMTPQERANPDMIKASRKRRIAAGSGTTVALINQLLVRHEQTRKMMKRFAKNPGGLMRTMSGMFNS